MCKLFYLFILLILIIYLLKDNKEYFKSKVWGFGMFEIPIFSITVDSDK